MPRVNAAATGEKVLKPATMIGRQAWRAIAKAFDLSQRQAQVAEGIVDGLKEKEIAAQLGISVNTVHEYVGRLYDRLDVHSRSQLVSSLLAFYLEYGRKRRSAARKRK